MFLFTICFMPVENSYLKTLLHFPQPIIPVTVIILWLCSGQAQHCRPEAVVIQAEFCVCGSRFPPSVLWADLEARGSCFAVRGGHGGLWDGHQQGRYPAGHPLRGSQGDGILLPGDGESGARRAARCLPRPLGCHRPGLQQVKLCRQPSSGPFARGLCSSAACGLGRSCLCLCLSPVVASLG